MTRMRRDVFAKCTALPKEVPAKGTSLNIMHRGASLMMAAWACAGCSDANGVQTNASTGEEVSQSTSALAPPRHDVIFALGSPNPAPGLPTAPAGPFDFPATKVGTLGNVTVYYDPSLGSQGLSLAQQLLNVSAGPYLTMQTFFGMSGQPVSVVIAAVAGKTDGSGGAYHKACDFSSGGVLYLDATFSTTTADPLNLEVGQYTAELSESFMGPQGAGWNCGASNGEGLSVYLAENEALPHTFDSLPRSTLAWVLAGAPDWITSTENTDKDLVSVGAALAYLYWMRYRGFSITSIVAAGGTTLAQNYTSLTGATTAYQDLIAALSAGVTFGPDNPFPPQTTDVVSIQTTNGYLLTAVNGGGIGGPNTGSGAAAIHTDSRSATPGTWERLRILPAGGNQTAFETATAHYVTAVRGGGIGGPNANPYEIHTDATSAGAWEHFRTVWLSNGQSALQTMNGYWVTVVNGGGFGGSDPNNQLPIHTNASRIGPWESFMLN